MLASTPFKIQCAGFASAAAIASSTLPAIAVSIEQVPNPRQNNGGWVTDMADVLSAPTELKLNQMISELEAENSSEIAVVTVPETSPSKSPKTFATELFNTWGIGKKGKDNGVLFLVSKGDRRVEIETGYGIEPILPNTEVKQLIDDQIIPSLKQDHFDQGVLSGTSVLVTALQNKDSGRSSRPWSTWIKQWWKIMLFGILWLCSLFFNRGSSHNHHAGSSGGGFGGGSSGGGGAGGGF
ncbi:hypothetical protein C1752_06369 [Acaryochloris thomasi RCC1774]|uniref:TPM domain-containing protein n=1 Tax=Acaryochloris thomasi RCC1774 TaxID=1764569 RepID=A0A2W1JKF9_9CYAN|nr:TPM domain-containing protein [Acaryochloris thomasi]PZD71452.1 hypothetical protein C1752_06369 [Acaryochloris thomasi RCC1774]